MEIQDVLERIILTSDARPVTKPQSTTINPKTSFKPSMIQKLRKGNDIMSHMAQAPSFSSISSWILRNCRAASRASPSPSEVRMVARNFEGRVVSKYQLMSERVHPALTNRAKTFILVIPPILGLEACCGKISSDIRSDHDIT